MITRAMPDKNDAVRQRDQLRPRAASRRTDTTYQAARASSMARDTGLRVAVCHAVSRACNSTGGEMTSAGSTVITSVHGGDGAPGHPADGLESLGDRPRVAGRMIEVLQSLGVEHVLEAPLERVASEVRGGAGDEALVHRLVEHDEAVGMVH